MDLKNLQQHIRTLATVSETDAPILSAYFSLEGGRTPARDFLQRQSKSTRKTIAPAQREAFDEAVERIAQFLDTQLFPEANGVSVFARAGNAPFFLALQFRAPLPNWLAVDTVPNIYHLVELKDTYHRYVVLISTEESARILEVNLGAVTEQLWAMRPELRRRVGREWSKEHYQNHHRERTNRFIKEKVKLLEQLMMAGGHTHLILAGNPFLCARIRAALPKHLQAKLIDLVVAGSRDEISDVVEATLATFIQQEERESHELVETLQREIRTNGLAVLGAEECLEAMTQGRADVLVLARTLPDARMRETLARTAEINDVQIQVVNQSDVLMEMGGVGCLLRYRTAYEPAHQAMIA